MSGIKLVFLGDSEVGKSCIITRFLNGVFDSRQAISEGSFANKTIEIPEIRKSLDLEIWDTNGREQYRALNKFFYQDAKIVILVYDTTRKVSYDNMINTWYNDLKENGEPNVIIGIVGSKSDLYEEEAVPEYEARNFAESIGAIFCLTSAQKNSGIDELFSLLGKKYLESISTTIESDMKKPEQKEDNKFDERDVVEKNEEQKKKKKCIII